jgi:hypothetical protein
VSVIQTLCPPDWIKCLNETCLSLPFLLIASYLPLPTPGDGRWWFFILHLHHAAVAILLQQWWRRLCSVWNFSHLVYLFFFCVFRIKELLFPVSLQAIGLSNRNCACVCACVCVCVCVCVCDLHENWCLYNKIFGRNLCFKNLNAIKYKLLSGLRDLLVTGSLYILIGADRLPFNEIKFGHV